MQTNSLQAGVKYDSGIAYVQNISEIPPEKSNVYLQLSGNDMETLDFAKCPSNHIHRLYFSQFSLSNSCHTALFEGKSILFYYDVVMLEIRSFFNNLVEIRKY